ncbi:MAG: 1,3-beta-galactosyl-N-acetylhexosamine phosphorylase [Anaerolineae bacterium]|nr:1,3-beta-galactosyl-N-acetylhexosamine phosphorylase [Anaerolineae bacterium]
MNNSLLEQGNFTLPGEAGYEDLTLELAERWGADAIRDSDGTVLSDRIITAGFDIYSTLCLIRADNEWAKANQDKLQQNYLMSYPVVANSDTVRIDLLNGYFREQFKVNVNDNPQTWWQVFDRTSGQEIPADQWEFDPNTGMVTITRVEKWHKYTVNFLAYRIWEAISMYNHITNNWGDREHLMPVDPIYPQTQEFMLGFLEKWLADHPRTEIVRFTSMFYNFAWFWGDSPNLRYIYSDWGAYDNTVSPYALREFSKTRGYTLTSEDFVNGGAYCSSHQVPSARYLAWLDFTNDFVVTFGRQCIDLVHRAGKEAYMFYDDHWVGTEPYGDRFKDFSFDGMIKCVFNGFEARLCAGVQGVKTRELRLHPYLFPTGLKGEPTFKTGGDPTRDARNFWVNIRRGLLRESVDRIGLGGYLHLVRDYPDFVDYIEELVGEFRTLREICQNDKPYTAPFKVVVLTAWGKLRSWICNGHFIHGLELNELIESLSGLPVDVEFMNFDDILEKGIPAEVKVIINSGRAATSWGGGEHWKNDKVIAAITGWVAQGGGFIGVGEPSACEHKGQYFQLSHLLGVDRANARSLSKEKFVYPKPDGQHFIMADVEGELDFGEDVGNIFVLGDNTRVLADKAGSPRVAVHSFYQGRSVYFSGFKFTLPNTRLLHRAIFWAAGVDHDFDYWTCSNVFTECAYYPQSKKLVVINNIDKPETTKVFDAHKQGIEVSVAPLGIEIIQL